MSIGIIISRAESARQPIINCICGVYCAPWHQRHQAGRCDAGAGEKANIKIAAPGVGLLMRRRVALSERARRRGRRSAAAALEGVAVGIGALAAPEADHARSTAAAAT